MTQSAVADTRTANSTVTRLAEASQQIGSVVDLISTIAKQTNLLALNATIEAARAGDAGKGFAVVASEVKNLATQTASATSDITERINTIQSETTEAARALGGITGVIGTISQSLSEIAAAVEQQASSTAEINRNLDGVNTATSAVSSEVVTIRTAAEETNVTVHDMTRHLNDLAGQLAGLDQHVNALLSDLRAA